MQQRTAVRITVGDQVGVAVQLGGVAQDVRAEVAEPEGMRPVKSAANQPSTPRTRSVIQSVADTNRAGIASSSRKPVATGSTRPPSSIVTSTRYEAWVAGEAGKRVRDQEEEGEDVDVVADERARESVQRLQ